MFIPTILTSLLALTPPSAEPASPATHPIEDGPALARLMNWPMDLSRVQPCDETVLSMITPPEPGEARESTGSFCFITPNAEAEAVLGEIERLLVRDGFSLASREGIASNYTGHGKSFAFGAFPARPRQSEDGPMAIVVSIE